LAACDIVTLRSLLTEGVPGALIEAMAAGKPVVASAVGGIPEIVDSEVGALLPPGDSQALAAAIGRLAADPLLCQRCGEAGKRRAAARYDIRRAAARMAKVFSRIAQVKRCGF
ncbi:MAG: glycosyltransferase, partial [Planctomycetota bacterium]|nr:glycosyltransferase [Planctomycetota bacterium]